MTLYPIGLAYSHSFLASQIICVFGLCAWLFIRGHKFRIDIILFQECLGPVWFVCLKTENCCLKIFMEIRVGEKVY